MIKKKTYTETKTYRIHDFWLIFRRLLWEIRLNDSVLSLASHEEDGLRQVYAGLADGTVAVIEVRKYIYIHV